MTIFTNGLVGKLTVDLAPHTKKSSLTNNKNEMHCKNISYQSLTSFIHSRRFYHRQFPSSSSSRYSEWIQKHAILQRNSLVVLPQTVRSILWSDRGNYDVLGNKTPFNNIKLGTCNEIWQFVYITKKPW